VHTVRNRGTVNATSVHAYSPPLLPLREGRLDEGRLDEGRLDEGRLDEAGQA
jgi:hypothetical protein